MTKARRAHALCGRRQNSLTIFLLCTSPKTFFQLLYNVIKEWNLEFAAIIFHGGVCLCVRSIYLLSDNTKHRNFNANTSLHVAWCQWTLSQTPRLRIRYVGVCVHNICAHLPCKFIVIAQRWEKYSCQCWGYKKWWKRDIMQKPCAR